jgi:hypothetical protein
LPTDPFWPIFAEIHSEQMKSEQQVAVVGAAANSWECEPWPQVPCGMQRIQAETGVRDARHAGAERHDREVVPEFEEECVWLENF